MLASLQRHQTRIVKLIAAALIAKVLIGVLAVYSNYLPPNFESGFLQGRAAYFAGGYGTAFYVHIFSGPLALILGIPLMSRSLRRRWPQWHRWLGRALVVSVLLGVAPSGIWMAFYAETGTAAGLAFFLLGLATAICAAAGWRAARRRELARHQRWMSRCFLLLCSAVVLRIFGGFFTVSGISGDWTYIFAAWMSWLLPLALYEFTLQLSQRSTG